MAPGLTPTKDVKTLGLKPKGGMRENYESEFLNENLDGNPEITSGQGSVRLFFEIWNCKLSYMAVFAIHWQILLPCLFYLEQQSQASVSTAEKR